MLHKMCCINDTPWLKTKCIVYVYTHRHIAGSMLNFQTQLFPCNRQNIEKLLYQLDGNEIYFEKG